MKTGDMRSARPKSVSGKSLMKKQPAPLKLVLPALPDLKYKAALKRLRAARLILTTEHNAPLDCHPLIREHFAALMRETAPEALPADVQELVDRRAKARLDKDFKLADVLRLDLEVKGVIVEDTKQGQKWRTK